MIKFKKGDTVKIMAGKDKGREGKVETVLTRKNAVIVPGLNLYKRHIKASNAVDKKGGVYDIPRPISVAKIAIVCPNCKKVTRVGLVSEKGKKMRICRKCGKKIEGGLPVRAQKTK